MKGAECPHFRHGRYSAYLPVDILEQLERAAADPQLLSLRADVALVELLISETLAEFVGHRTVWADLESAGRALQAATGKADREQAAIALTRLDAAIDRLGHVSQLRDDLTRLLERKSKIVERENRHEHRIRGVITIEQFSVAVSMFWAAVQQQVPDPAARQKIYESIEQVYLHRSSDPAPAPE